MTITANFEHHSDPELSLNDNRPCGKGLVPFVCLALLFSASLSGCVSKATAEAQARAAFLAGQQQALERMQLTQGKGPSVTFVGEVKNNLVPWTADLTLAKAIVAADYFGPSDPKEIVISRDGQEMRVDPKQLLSGGDILLLPHDVVELRH